MSSITSAGFSGTAAVAASRLPWTLGVVFTATPASAWAASSTPVLVRLSTAR